MFLASFHLFSIKKLDIRVGLCGYIGDLYILMKLEECKWFKRPFQCTAARSCTPKQNLSSPSLPCIESMADFLLQKKVSVCSNQSS